MDNLFKLEEEMEEQCTKWAKNYISTQAAQELRNVFKSGFRIGWEKCRTFYKIN